MPELLEVDRLKFILENFHNFLLKETNKLEEEIFNLRGDLTL